MQLNLRSTTRLNFKPIFVKQLQQTKDLNRQVSKNQTLANDKTTIGKLDGESRQCFVSPSIKNC